MSQNLGSKENYAFVQKLLKGLSASEIFAIFAPCNIGMPRFANSQEPSKQIFIHTGGLSPL